MAPPPILRSASSTPLPTIPKHGPARCVTEFGYPSCARPATCLFEAVSISTHGVAVRNAHPSTQPQRKAHSLVLIKRYLMALLSPFRIVTTDSLAARWRGRVSRWSACPSMGSDGRVADYGMPIEMEVRAVFRGLTDLALPPRAHAISCCGSSNTASTRFGVVTAVVTPIIESDRMAQHGISRRGRSRVVLSGLMGETARANLA